MDDTAEIRARLGTIGALAEAGAGSRALLAEVRALLAEGEQAFRERPRGREPDPTAGTSAAASEGPERGREADVS